MGSCLCRGQLVAVVSHAGRHRPLRDKAIAAGDEQPWSALQKGPRDRPPKQGMISVTRERTEGLSRRYHDCRVNVDGRDERLSAEYKAWGASQWAGGLWSTPCGWSRLASACVPR